MSEPYWSPALGFFDMGTFDLNSMLRPRQSYLYSGDQEDTAPRPSAPVLTSHTSEHPTSSQKEVLAQRVASLGCELVDVPGDGDCQFHALAEVLNAEHGLAVDAVAVRRQVAEWLSKNPDFILPNGAKIREFTHQKGDMTWAEYTRALALPAAAFSSGTPVNGVTSPIWGDHLTLVAAAIVYGVRVQVVTAHRTLWLYEISPAELAKTPQADCSVGEGQERNGTVIIAHEAELHYHATRRLRTARSNVAEAPPLVQAVKRIADHAGSMDTEAIQGAVHELTSTEKEMRLQGKLLTDAGLPNVYSDALISVGTLRSELRNKYFSLTDRLLLKPFPTTRKELEGAWELILGVAEGEDFAKAAEVGHQIADSLESLYKAAEAARADPAVVMDLKAYAKNVREQSNIWFSAANGM